jgi:glycosyltransferase involved in cell wall biosynthesis
MRVTFLTHYFPPEVGAPQTRISGLAHALARRGVEVAVHAPPPHYPDGHIRSGYRNRLLAHEQEGGVEVLRSAVYPAANRGFARRLACHTSFGLSALATAGRTPDADLVVVETPPLFTAGAAIPYARRKRAKLVVNVADLWPDSAIELGALRSPVAIRAAKALERRCYEAAAAIACPTEGISERLAQRPSASGKVRRIAPAVDLDAFEPAPSERGGPFRVLYAGTVGMAQGVGTLLEAAGRLQASARRNGAAPVEVIVAGDGAEGPQLRSRAAGLPNVLAPGAVPHDRVPGMLAEADAAVVLLRDQPVFAGALPTKLLEAMAAARPVVLSASGEAARFVQASGGGVVVAPEDPAALADAIQELSDDPERARSLGAAGRRWVEAGHGRERFVDDWLELLRAVASNGPDLP